MLARKGHEGRQNRHSEQLSVSSAASLRGKLRAGLAVSWLQAACFVGMCIGFLLSQHLYVHSHQAGVLNDMRQEKGHIPPKKLGALKQRALGDRPSALLDVLHSIAPHGEVMVAISNYNLVAQGMLPLWLKTVQNAGVRNYVVVAIDEQLQDWCKEQGINVYFRDTAVDKAQEGTGENHAISALKFKILREFLALGWNVLLSDVDVVVVQNPFEHLYRDHDLEGMSDGFDQWTAYGRVGGLDDPSMGWARYAQSTEHLALNSGLFWMRASGRTVALMDRIAARLAKEQAWDQSVYNQELFFLSHDDYLSPNVSVRVMSIYKFMNTKVLFKEVRYRPRREQVLPVMVHTNYHPDKQHRMEGIIKYYLDHDDHALEGYPGGSEPGS